MSRIAPEESFSGIITRQPTKVIQVKPRPGNSDPTVSKIQMMSQSVPDANTWDIVKQKGRRVAQLGRPTMRVERSNSFVSKFIRFLRTDEYKFVSSTWDRVLVAISVVSFILGVMAFIWYAVVIVKAGWKVPETNITWKDGTKEGLYGLNMFSSVASIVRASLALVGAVAAYKQLQIIFKHNDFIKKRITERSQTFSVADMRPNSA